MTIKAVAILVGDSPVKGVVHFEQAAAGAPVKLTGEIKGLAPGQSVTNLTINRTDH